MTRVAANWKVALRVSLVVTLVFLVEIVLVHQHLVVLEQHVKVA